MKTVAKIGAAFLGAAALGGSAAFALTLWEQSASNETAVVRYAETIGGCAVTDGDTIRCGDERIRLLGIDAPELPGHCRSGRNCAPGDPYASTSSLGAAMIGELTIKRVGQDDYGRTLAMVAGDKGDLSCWQLRHEQVIYKAEWDDGLNVARTCPRDVF
ncbi:endonuclease YncB(thermonuclease family) [Novosphingobium chloroacetimidivorans]|uniref:Endonuclease YncB(Thermonuclease family) n=1 Tax=Novosphingobium chloroacetimidivorans TaxID=1428314 RepID=A0A7W7KB44_9SPHN|nr:thermonuclease family protein [Novosphingobium chloroacetimidivorans]MBB4859231.1 endonuclease YncB(thermonuclease family) [Novosphingobium chloroacetimidivorans]